MKEGLSKIELALKPGDEAMGSGDVPLLTVSRFPIPRILLMAVINSG